MELSNQTNYQLYVISNLNKVGVNTELVLQAKTELSQRKLPENELKSLSLRYKTEYSSVGVRQKETYYRLMGLLLLFLGTVLSLIIYILPFAIFIFIAGAHYILDSNFDKTKKRIIIGAPILLLILLYFLVLPCI
jgi:hypothetical protein